MRYLTLIAVFIFSQSAALAEEVIEGVVVRDPYPRLWTDNEVGVRALILVGETMALPANGRLARITGQTLNNSPDIFQIQRVEPMPGELQFDTPIAKNLGIQTVSGSLLNAWCDGLRHSTSCGSDFVTTPPILLTDETWLLVSSFNALPVSLDTPSAEITGRIIQAGDYLQVLANDLAGD